MLEGHREEEAKRLGLKDESKRVDIVEKWFRGEEATGGVTVDRALDSLRTLRLLGSARPALLASRWRTVAPSELMVLYKVYKGDHLLPLLLAGDGVCPIRPSAGDAPDPGHDGINITSRDGRILLAETLPQSTPGRGRLQG